MRIHSLRHCVLGTLALGLLLACQVQAATRLGLHYTQQEVWCWRQRAGLDAQGSNGVTCPVKYVTAGDVSANSPGDWTRIVSNRNTFAATPSRGRWLVPQTVGGCVEPNSNTYGWPEGPSEGGNGGINWSIYLRDAAFYGLVTGTTTNQAAIKQELLWVSSQSFTQWGNAAGPWCFDRLWDIAPSFGITSVLVKLLFAYEYVGRGVFTQGERDQLDRWFFDAADFWRRDMDVSLNEQFVDRWAGDYTRTQPCQTPAPLAYAGGPLIYSLPQFYTNRRSVILRFSVLAGLSLQEAGRTYTNGRYGTLAQVIQSGKMYAQEYVRFSIFPQGLVGDFERNDPSLPDLGWAYSQAALGAVTSIADAFARTGDASLYQYTTALGECGTAGTISDGGSRNGQNKDLLFAVQAQMKYITDVYARYWPDTSTQDNRIDARHPRNGSSWQSARDTMTLFSNGYFQDAFIKQAYTRTHANSIPYPAGPEDAPQPWQGDNAIFPAVLFMFGGLEGSIGKNLAIDPYVVGTTAVLAPPTNLRVVP